MSGVFAGKFAVKKNTTARQYDWPRIFKRTFWALSALIFLSTPVLKDSILNGVEATLTVFPAYALASLLAEGLARSVLVGIFHTMLYMAPVGAVLWPLHNRLPRVALAALGLWSIVFVYVGFIAVVEITP